MGTDIQDWRQGLEARFGSPLRRFFRRRTRSEEEARDLTQELFVRVLGQDGARQVDNPDAYLFTVASNLLREQGRRAAVRGSSVVGAVDTDICAFLQSEHEDLTPVRILEGREAVKRFLAALESLGEVTRSIFILYRIEGMKQKDIARKMGISVSAVEKHVAKALVHLTREVEL